MVWRAPRRPPRYDCHRGVPYAPLRVFRVYIRRRRAPLRECGGSRHHRDVLSVEQRTVAREYGHVRRPRRDKLLQYVAAEHWRRRRWRRRRKSRPYVDPTPERDQSRPQHCVTISTHVMFSLSFYHHHGRAACAAGEYADIYDNVFWAFRTVYECFVLRGPSRWELLGVSVYYYCYY